MGGGREVQAGGRPAFDAEISLRIGPRRLGGHLVRPAGARGLVLFAHGSGSSRASPRNRAVAEHLNGHHLATLCFDFLSPEEAAWDARTATLRFDIPLLSGRLLEAVRWARSEPAVRDLPLAFFGASTGAAAALAVAADLGTEVRAVVSRGGRPDLAGEGLPRVQAATLLIVGGADLEVLALNRSALRSLTCDRDLQIVPGAGHLFEEPGALDQVCALATAWFLVHLPAEAPSHAHVP